MILMQLYQKVNVESEVDISKQLNTSKEVIVEDTEEVVDSEQSIKNSFCIEETQKIANITDNSGSSQADLEQKKDLNIEFEEFKVNIYKEIREIKRQNEFILAGLKILHDLVKDHGVTE